MRSTASTAMTTPSRARCRRSRRTTSVAAPTVTPSTRTELTGTCPARRIPAGAELEDVADVDQRDALRGHAGPGADLLVEHHVPELAVDRHAVPRVEQLDEEPELVLARVAGDVDAREGLVDHLGAEAHQVVDRVGDGLLVPRDRRRRDDDRVARDDPDLLVVAVRDPAQGGARLALRPRRDEHHLAWRQTTRDLDADERIAGVEVAEVGGRPGS